MQLTARIAVYIFLLTSALASAYYNGAKPRRDRTRHINVYPRLGRASHNTWQVPLNDIIIEYEPSEKRQMYAAFPRVGRGEASLLRADSLLQPAPIRRTDSSGMWFGPRLGRSLSTEDDDNGAKPRRDRTLHMNVFPRLGRASNNTWQVPLNELFIDITTQNKNEPSEPEQMEVENTERELL